MILLNKMKALVKKIEMDFLMPGKLWCVLYHNFSQQQSRLQNHFVILFLITITIMVICGYAKEYCMAYLSMLLHELGHTFTAAFFGNSVNFIKISPFGFKAEIEGKNIITERLIIYLCGPLTNILLFLISVIIASTFPYHKSIFTLIAYLNICLAVFNLLPVMPLDGGRIIFELACARLGSYKAHKYICYVSYVLSVFFIIVGCVLVSYNMANFCLVLIGIFILGELKSFKREVAIMNMKDVIYRRSRLLKKGIYPARDLVVVKTMRMGDIIRNLDFDRFHIIHVLDEDLKLLKVFTEQDIMDGVVKHSGDMTFEEFIMTDE
ncbi:peptidase M50 [Pseudobacteroides cellulosolvens ATCC 35603 = DSM 2933]|uniref:Peptidase M50 n=2 Tax=Pseudobacteroides cellulosolvens TaxID=35825 RepID=A0A0L6JMQ7_9FIRM|nr:peptidase M50 [Pseudobacteroides cellulosolvens ATCC 35603 = DSM 2933]